MKVTVSTGAWNSFMHTSDCTCMLTFTMMCAKQVQIWPIPWHRIAHNFMHIESKMHEIHMVRIWNMHYAHFRLYSLPACSHHLQKDRWQMRHLVKKSNNFFAYFNHITRFKVPYRWISVKSGAHSLQISICTSISKVCTSHILDKS